MRFFSNPISLLGLLSAVAAQSRVEVSHYPITFYRKATDFRTQSPVWGECMDIPEPELYGRDMCYFYVGTFDEARSEYAVWDKAECSFYNGLGCTLEKDYKGNVPKGPHVVKGGFELFDTSLTLRSYTCQFNE